MTRCLVADDCGFQRRYAKSILVKIWGETEFHEATNVKTALCQLQKVNLDLALLDDDMGDGTSLEAIPSLIGTSCNRLPPLIMVSGNLDPTLPNRALQVGFSGFISKDELSLRTLREVLGSI